MRIRTWTKSSGPHLRVFDLRLLMVWEAFEEESIRLEGFAIENEYCLAR